MEDKKPFKCCNEPVPIEIFTQVSPLDSEFVDKYLTMILEQSTPNPVYCFDPSCAAFIPPVMARGPDELDCLTCNKTTCRHCKGQAHPSRSCPQDLNTQKLESLGSQMGWKRCPKCTAMIDRIAGCSMMTCRCGRVFYM
jgi:hypothetical protein